MARRSFATIRQMATALLISAPVLAEEPPRRIVSLNLCTDQLLVELVARERIAAVTHLAADPAVSAIPEKAHGIPTTQGAAEDVLRFDPDLILAGPFGARATVDLLRRLGKRVVIVPQPQDLDGVRAAVRLSADAVGAVDLGNALIADFDRRMSQIPPAIFRLPESTALVYQVNGLVAGRGSLAEAALAAAGFRNIALSYPLTRGGQVPLEILLSHPPDLLVLASTPTEYLTAMADNLRHPAVRRLREQRPSVDLPWRLWLCGTPHIADAIELLAAARIRIEALRP